MLTCESSMCKARLFTLFPLRRRHLNAERKPNNSSSLLCAASRRSRGAGRWRAPTGTAAGCP
eukprot:11222540-Lingulodinium_polyedra.AAC.1